MYFKSPTSSTCNEITDVQGSLPVSVFKLLHPVSITLSNAFWGRAVEFIITKMQMQLLQNTYLHLKSLDCTTSPTSSGY